MSVVFSTGSLGRRKEFAATTTEVALPCCRCEGGIVRVESWITTGTGTDGGGSPSYAPRSFADYLLSIVPVFHFFTRMFTHETNYGEGKSDV